MPAQATRGCPTSRISYRSGGKSPDEGGGLGPPPLRKTACLSQIYGCATDGEHVRVDVGGIRRQGDVVEPDLGEAPAAAAVLPTLAARQNGEAGGRVEDVLVGEREGLVSERGSRDPQLGHEAGRVAGVESGGDTDDAFAL